MFFSFNYNYFTQDQSNFRKTAVISSFFSKNHLFKRLLPTNSAVENHIHEEIMLNTSFTDLWATFIFKNICFVAIKLSKKISMAVGLWKSKVTYEATFIFFIYTHFLVYYRISVTVKEILISYRISLAFGKVLIRPHSFLVFQKIMFLDFQKNSICYKIVMTFIGFRRIFDLHKQLFLDFQSNFVPWLSKKLYSLQNCLDFHCISKNFWLAHTAFSRFSKKFYSLTFKKNSLHYRIVLTFIGSQNIFDAHTRLFSLDIQVNSVRWL